MSVTFYSKAEFENNPSLVKRYGSYESYVNAMEKELKSISFYDFANKYASVDFADTNLFALARQKEKQAERKAEAEQESKTILAELNAAREAFAKAYNAWSEALDNRRMTKYKYGENSEEFEIANNDCRTTDSARSDAWNKEYSLTGSYIRSVRNGMYLG